MSNSFVFVAMDNHKANIWNRGLEIGAKRIDVEAIEPLEEHDARACEPKSGEAPATFLAEITSHLKDANAILLMGPGKGKASGPLHLRDYLARKYPDLANRIYEIENADIAHTSDNELLAHARIEWARFKNTH